MILRIFLFTVKHPLFLQKSRTFSTSKSPHSLLYFPGNFEDFHGTGTTPDGVYLMALLTRFRRITRRSMGSLCATSNESWISNTSDLLIAA
jgi:hypothetical protein